MNYRIVIALIFAAAISLASAQNSGKQKDSEDEAWIVLARINQQSAYQNYLDSYPNGKYRTAAQLAISFLNQSPQNSQTTQSVLVTPQPINTPVTSSVSSASLTALSNKKGVALVIGNSNYVVKPLMSPINDANDIANKLETMGYKVRRIIDGDRRHMMRNLEAFRLEAEKADVGFVYYAGHGVQVNGVNYILPIDFNLESGMASVEFDGFPFNNLLKFYVPTATKLIFIEICGTGKHMTNGIDNSRTLYSLSMSICNEPNNSSRNSRYTKALLDHLTDNDDINVVLKRVREQVLTQSGGKQQPWVSGSLTGGPLVLSSINKK